MEEEVTNDGVAGWDRHGQFGLSCRGPSKSIAPQLPETQDFTYCSDLSGRYTSSLHGLGVRPVGVLHAMDWLTHILPIVAAFLEQHGLLSAFVVLLVEEAGVPLPVPGDVLMLVVGVRVHQAHLVLWQVLAVMEAATVLGAGILYVVSARAGRPLVHRYGRFLRLNPARLGRAEDWIRQGGWRAIVLLRLVPGLRIATVVGCGIFGVPFRLFLPALAFGGFGYLVVYTLLGYFVGPEILAMLAQLHA